MIIELKTHKLTHQDLGQLQMYVNYYDRTQKLADENPTIGILLSADKNNAVVKFTLPEDNKTILSSQYKLYLPTEKELKQELANEMKEFREQKSRAWQMSENNGIPKHWRVKKLGEECKCVTGTTPPKNESKNYGNDIPFVKPPQLFDKPINNAPEKLSNRGADLARVLPINSVLVTCIGNLGRTAINKIPVAFNQQINAIIPSVNIDGRFLFIKLNLLNSEIN